MKNRKNFLGIILKDSISSGARLISSSLQGRLDAIDTDKAVEFVLSCMNFDGGFGCRPGSESHAGQVPIIPHYLLYTAASYAVHCNFVLV